MLRRLATSSAPAVLVAAAGVGGMLLWYGLPPESLVRYTAYLIGLVAVPGVFTWRLLLASLHQEEGRTPTWYEDLTLGTIFGFGVQLPFYLLGVAVGAPVLLTLAPPVIVAAISATPYGRSIWKLPTSRLDVRAAWALSALLLYGMVWLREAFVRRPLWLDPNRPPSVDETFHQALVAEISLRFPAEIPFLLGTRLDYHWFVHGQLAATHAVAELAVPTMLRFVLPTVVLLLGLLGLGAVALRLSRRPIAAVIAPTLMVAGAYHLFGPDFDSERFMDQYLSRRFVSSPSQAYGIAVSMPALMLILEVLRPKRGSYQGARPLVWVALTLALLALSGAKATFMPIFVCAAIGVWVIRTLQLRRIDLSVSLLLVLLVAVTLFAQFVLFGGQSGALEVLPFRTVEMALRPNEIEENGLNVTLMTLAMLLGWLLYGVGLVGLRKKLADPRAVWLLIAIPTGMTVPFVLYRTGLSQLWFSRTVAELVVLISAWGVACLLPKHLSGRYVTGLTAVAAAMGAGGFALSYQVQEALGTPLATVETMWLTLLVPVGIVVVWSVVRLAGLLPKVPTVTANVLIAALLGLSTIDIAEVVWFNATGRELRGPVPPNGGKPLFAIGGVEAARHIADNADPYAIVATNVHCKAPDTPRCDNRNFWVAAWSERRVVVEGWGYTAGTNAANDGDQPSAFVPITDPARLAVNDAVFTDPSRENLERLVDRYGADWLLVSKAYDADVRGLYSFARQTGLIEREFANNNYVVYRITLQQPS